jgi:hypothetical protein
VLIAQANNYFCACNFPTSYGAGADCGPTTYFVSMRLVIDSLETAAVKEAYPMRGY